MHRKKHKQHIISARTIARFLHQRAKRHTPIHIKLRNMKGQLLIGRDQHLLGHLHVLQRGFDGLFGGVEASCEELQCRCSTVLRTVLFAFFLNDLAELHLYTQTDIFFQAERLRIILRLTKRVLRIDDEKVRQVTTTKLPWSAHSLD